ncbi:S24 family peptidase [Pedobacter aquatilis]|uniref:S24 family peptidase n=1 Tax=Pedobacter aquatilis TaxID=351343 RepID=UPI0025B480B3|nr:S24 family peptidase [Pedobacter aquatilis]MDN3588801.1 S24 family peptidase [Pedobacter aquatilis]
MIRSFEKRAEQKISGFQSPAADYLEGRLDIVEKLVVDPHVTFYFKMEGDAMNAYGLQDGDLLIVDKSLHAVHGAMVVAFISGAYTCRIYIDNQGIIGLQNGLDVLKTFPENDALIWGVITAVCRGVLPSALKQGRYRDVCAL